jgi:hypothetical protein
MWLGRPSKKKKKCAHQQAGGCFFSLPAPPITHPPSITHWLAVPRFGGGWVYHTSIGLAGRTPSPPVALARCHAFCGPLTRCFGLLAGSNGHFSLFWLVLARCRTHDRPIVRRAFECVIRCVCMKSHTTTHPHSRSVRQNRLAEPPRRVS